MRAPWSIGVERSVCKHDCAVIRLAAPAKMRILRSNHLALGYPRNSSQTRSAYPCPSQSLDGTAFTRLARLLRKTLAPRGDRADSGVTRAGR